MDKWLNDSNISKIIALALAIILWAVVHFDEDTPNKVASLINAKVIEDVKIKPTGLDDRRYILKSIEPEVVRIQVRGQRSALTSAMPENYKVKLDLTGVGEGTHTLNLTYDFPSGIQLVTMEPSIVTVQIEELQTKEVDINIVAEGKPAKGYKAGTPIILPTNRAHVTLPKSRLKDVQTVSATINIEDKDASVKQKRVKLTAYDKAGLEIKDAIITPPVAEVEIPITKPFKSVPLQISYIGALPQGLAIASMEPDINQVALYGQQDVLDQMEFYDAIQVDLSQLTESSTITMSLPVPAKVEKIEPSVVHFNVKVVPAVQKVLDKVPITLSGESDQLKVAIVNPESKHMSLTLEGAPSLLNALKVEDVQLIANISDLPPGTHQVALQVNLPNFIHRVDTGTLYAMILIEEKATPTGTTPVEKEQTVPDGSNSAGKDSNQSGGANAADPNSSKTDSGTTEAEKADKTGANNGKTQDKPEHDEP